MFFSSHDEQQESLADADANSDATHKKMKMSHITRRLRLSGLRMRTRPTHFQPSASYPD